MFLKDSYGCEHNAVVESIKDGAELVTYVTGERTILDYWDHWPTQKEIKESLDEL